MFYLFCKKQNFCENTLRDDLSLAAIFISRVRQVEILTRLKDIL